MGNDPRYLKLRAGLSRLSSDQLRRILSWDARMVYDQYNYDPATGRY